MFLKKPPTLTGREAEEINESYLICKKQQNKVNWYVRARAPCVMGYRRRADDYGFKAFPLPAYHLFR